MAFRVPVLITSMLLALQVNASLDSDLLAGIEARNIGPAAVGGRITAIDVVTFIVRCNGNRR